MTKISELNTIVSVDRATDLLEIVDASDLTQSYKTTVNGMLGFTGGNPTSTTDTQTLTNKTLTSPTINTPTLTVLDNALTIQDNVDTTKQAQFQVSSVTTGQTRTYTLPDRSDTLVDLGSTQTLTSKTLTAPTITNPTLTVDTVSEFTAANGVTIDGLNIKDAALATANSVPNSTLSNTGSFGSAWSWTSWTPTLANLSGGTINYAEYTQIGKTVHFRFKYTLAGAGMGTGPTLTLPVAAAAEYVVGDTIEYTGVLYDITGSRWWPFCLLNSTTVLGIHYLNATPNLATITATAPFTWAVNDTVHIAGSYEAA